MGYPMSNKLPENDMTQEDKEMEQSRSLIA